MAKEKVTRKRFVKQFGLKCLDCGSEIFSEYRHDMKYCHCGQCFVDGGLDYFRAGAQRQGMCETIVRRVSLDGR